jgi:hypothetical protein
MERGSGGEAAPYVFHGEAPESDDEEYYADAMKPDTGTVKSQKNINSLVPGEASESSDEDSAVTDSIPRVPLVGLGRGQRPVYDSLLHKKLREAHGRLNDHAVNWNGKELEQGMKSLRTTGQQLSKSKQIMQETSNAMRLITNDLFQLEDKISIVASCTLLPHLHTAIPSGAQF